MNTTMRWFTLALVIGVVWQTGVAGTVLGTEGRKCYPPTWTNGAMTSSISVYGDWIENIDRVTTNASGVTVAIVAKFSGMHNSAGTFAGKGKVTLAINTTNATAGNKTITLIDDPVLGIGGTTFTFTIAVLALPRVTSVDVPTPVDAFKEITVTLHGTGLQGALDPAHGSIVADNLIPFITMGDYATLGSVRVLGSSATSLQARIVFTALVQDATVELAFDSNAECEPFRLHRAISTGGFKTRVRVKCGNVKNYVESFSFPQGSSTFDMNSTGTIHLKLLFAAPRISLIASPPDGRRNPLLTGSGDAGNSKVFFKFAPAEAFARADGTPFSTISGGFIQVSANPGEDVIPITFKVISCPGSQSRQTISNQSGQTHTVELKTWMHTTNTDRLPGFSVRTFSVHCVR